MKKTRFTEEQIAFALRQVETGTKVAEVCRKMGVAEATFYNWKKKYGGLGISELRRLKQLEEENRQLQKSLIYVVQLLGEAQFIHHNFIKII